nr:MAG TPA: hypothetical protein [Caudoviricetes sp.]
MNLILVGFREEPKETLFLKQLILFLTLTLRE